MRQTLLQDDSQAIRHWCRAGMQCLAWGAVARQFADEEGPAFRLAGDGVDLLLAGERSTERAREGARLSRIECAERHRRDGGIALGDGAVYGLHWGAVAIL